MKDLKDKKCNCQPECNCDNEQDCKCDCQESSEEVCDCQECECCQHDDIKDSFSTKKHHKHSKHDDSNHKLEEANNKIKELEEKLIRMSADNVNYRKRKDEEVIRIMKYANEDIIKEILPIMDNFERAIKVGSSDETMLSGIKMVYNSLEAVLTSFDVKAINDIDKPFDPTCHNALLAEHKEGVEPGIILDVLQKGYLYKDKIIRPAMVKVSE
jgi:molecular chaperone GrpE